MSTSIYLARLIGPPLAVIGLGMAINRTAYRAMAEEFLRSPETIYLGAVLGLLGGVALVLAHNTWVTDWRVIITLLGWISVVDAAAWILFPEAMTAFGTALMDSMALPLIGGGVSLLLGALLSFFGYSAARKSGD